MHYFISTREDYNTSAIELAQVKRMEIFDALKVSCKIVEIEKNDFVEECQQKLHTNQRVINLYQYFQKLPQKTEISSTELLNRILNHEGLERRGNNAYLKEKAVIKANLYNNRLYYVDYLDQYGFTVKREFYSYNHLNYIEYFDDQAHLKMREFVDTKHNPVIRQYFCQSNQNQPMLTLIELKDGLNTLRFESEADFQAYFLDQVAASDKSAVFYCDRLTQGLPAIEKMKQAVPSYVIFHSALTPSGYLNDEVYTVFQPVTRLAQAGKIRGMISSTRQEAEDAKKALQVQHSYAIPVTYIQPEKQVSFKERTPFKIIAVARVDAIKQLSHLLKAVISLRSRFPQISLDIYGNNTDEPENQRLQKIVADNQAQSYIHFCGFAQDLDAVYNSAQLEVLTSKNEGFAMALLEAQAHGCPAISYNINYGPADIIEEGISGRLLPANDQTQLTQCIAELLIDQKLLAQYSANAYLAARRFDFEHLKEKWQNFLQEEGLC